MNKYRLSLLSWALIVFAIVLVTCKKTDQDNPFDPECKLTPNEWAPQNLSVQDVSITEKKLTWTFEVRNIEGFKLDRRTNNGSWESPFKLIGKELRSYTDTTILPDTGLTYEYRLYAYAAANQSEQKLITSKAIFPEPTELTTEKSSDVRYHLNWKDNCKGEDGYRIDKRIGDGEWQIGFRNVAADQITMTDSNVFRSMALEYRVYAYYKTYESDKIAINTTCDLPGPSSLQLTLIDASTTNLTWQDNSNGEDGFRIEKQALNGDWEILATVAGDIVSYQDDSFSLSTTVNYRVSAVAGQFSSPASEALIAAPTINTSDALNVTSTYAQCAGIISGNNIPDITDRGICYGITQNPTIAGPHSNGGIGSGSFLVPLSPLTENTLYYFRAYATTIAGTFYSDQKSFNTLGVPQLTTATVTDITNSTATSGGNITNTGSSTVVARGVCWSTAANPTTNDPHTSNGTGIGSFISQLTDLTANTLYYVRSYATNTTGTAYGNQLTFTTNAIVNTPTVTTTAITLITNNGASGGGNVTNSGGASVTSRGVCWSANQSPTIADSHTTDGTGIGEFTSSIAGLIPITTYYVRSYATNSAGTSYGTQVSFTTLANALAPSVTTALITNISVNTATGGGNVTSDGGSAVTVRGVCWATSPNPTITNFITTDGTGTGTFVSNLTDLSPTTLYYVRAYATNSIGTTYGNQTTFTTLTSISLPTVSTIDATNIGQTYATGGGNVTADGGASVTAKGVCWSTSSNPVVTGSHTTDGTGTGVFSSNITGLNANTLYHVRAYATNSQGTAYGNEVTFTTQALAYPSVTTTVVTNITTTTAQSGGNVTNDGGTTVTVRGVCWSTSQNPTISNPHTTDGNGTGIFISNITALTPNTTYYARAYATNSVGTAYGSQESFTTVFSIVLPTVTTSTVTDITQTTATSGGNVTSDGGGTVTARGVCWSTSQSPTITNSHTTDGSGTGEFTSSLTGLSANTLYYVRAYATNSMGTSYGSELSFTTLSNWETITDIDGNVYSIVEIGTQTWMRENLKVIHYNNGDPITNITDDGEWSSTIDGAYCWYNNDETINGDVYGALYNQYTVLDNRGLCPTGWIVPGPEHFGTLTSFLGDQSISGGKLKESGYSHWQTPNTGATDEFDFTALPAGIRQIPGGTFYDLTYHTKYWSTLKDMYGSYTLSLNFSEANLFLGYGVTDRKFGLSVRCVLGSPNITLPTVSTTSITEITSSSAIGGGEVTSDGGGTVTARGVCWSTSQNPTTTDSHTTDGSGTGDFTSSLTGLTANTLYYVRAYATNSVGTAYGNEISFTTSAETVTDIDGNVYSTVVIGTQTWMAENLKVTHYRNGEPIPNVTDNTQWGNQIGAYCWYNNDEATYGDTYGAMYNWFSVVDSRNLCPTGWHIPSDAEWTTLTTFLDGEIVAGGKMKETGTSHWNIPNTDATNESSFTGLPGGYRYVSGVFYYLGTNGDWWSSTECDAVNAWDRGLYFDLGAVSRGIYFKGCGFSVRCVKD